jgi:hypothetical protein
MGFQACASAESIKTSMTIHGSASSSRTVPAVSTTTLGAVHRLAYSQRLDKDPLWLKNRENDVRHTHMKVCFLIIIIIIIIIGMMMMMMMMNICI